MEIEKKLDYKKPILVDNRNFRKINPNINYWKQSGKYTIDNAAQSAPPPNKTP